MEKKPTATATRFVDNGISQEVLLSEWETSWKICSIRWDQLTSASLTQTVYIRNNRTRSHALQRQLVHYAYHSGQIVYLCKQIQAAISNRSPFARRFRRFPALTSPPPRRDSRISIRFGGNSTSSRVRVRSSTEVTLAEKACGIPASP